MGFAGFAVSLVVIVVGFVVLELRIGDGDGVGRS